MVYKWIDIALNALYPPRCLLCGAPGHAGMDLCPGCLADLPRNRPCCPRCALPTRITDTLCGECLAHAPPFDHCLAPLRYQGAVSDLVTAFKFGHGLGQGRLLSRIMGDFLEPLVADGRKPQLILPIPLHPSRLRERGYNQALELARPLGRRFGIPVDHRRLARHRNTMPQTELPKDQRRNNLRGAFELRRPLGASHVALVDDVVTTGSTAREAARLLKRAGVKRVDVWCVARTP